MGSFLGGIGNFLKKAVGEGENLIGDLFGDNSPAPTPPKAPAPAPAPINTASSAPSPVSSLINNPISSGGLRPAPPPLATNPVLQPHPIVPPKPINIAQPTPPPAPSYHNPQVAQAASDLQAGKINQQQFSNIINSPAISQYDAGKQIVSTPSTLPTDRAGLQDALNHSLRYSDEDNIRLLQRGAQAGLVPRNTAATYIENSLTPQPYHQPSTASEFGNAAVNTLLPGLTNLAREEGTNIAANRVLNNSQLEGGQKLNILNQSYNQNGLDLNDSTGKAIRVGTGQAITGATSLLGYGRGLELAGDIARMGAPEVADNLASHLKNAAFNGIAYGAPMGVGQTLQEDNPNLKSLAGNVIKNTAQMAAIPAASAIAGSLTGGLKLGEEGSIPLKNEPEGDPLDAKAYAQTYGVSKEEAEKGVEAANSSDLDKLHQYIAKQDAIAENLSPKEEPISNTEARQNILQGFQDGATTDAVIYKYMNDTGLPLEKAAKDVGQVIKSAGYHSPTENPYRGKVGLPGSKDYKGAYLNADTVTGQLEDARLKARQAVESLQPKDVAALRDIETMPVEQVAKTAKDKESFQQAADALRHYYNLRDAWDNYLGVDHGYRFNYLRQIMDKPSDATGPLNARGGNQAPGYTKARQYETLRTNVLDALDREAGATHNLGKLAYQKGLIDAYGDQISKGESKQNPGEGAFKTIDNKYGGGTQAAPDLADEINARAGITRSKGFTGIVGKAYDAGNAFLKASKLALGGFHDVVSYAAFTGKELASGHLSEMLQPLGSKFSPEHFNSLKEGFASDVDRQGYSMMDKFRLAGLTLGRNETAADAGGTILLKGKYNPIKIAHDSLFQRELPAAKMIMMAQEINDHGWRVNNAADLEQMRGAARSINQGIGGINRAVDGLTPTQAHWLAKATLAEDYNEGQIRATLGALTKGGAEGRVARQIIGGKIAIFAIPGLIQVGLDPNKRDKPAEWGKAFLNGLVDPHVNVHFPNPGGIDKGMTKAIKFAGDPAITKAYRIVQPLWDKNQVGLSGKLSGLQHEGVGNMASLPAAIIGGLTNKDYYGNPLWVRNPDGSFSPGKTVVNTALSQAPISVNQIAKSVRGQQSPLETAINISGVGRTANSPEDPQAISTAAHYNQLNQYEQLVKSGKLSQIDPALKDVSPAVGQEMWNNGYAKLHAPSTKDEQGNTIPSDWNALSSEQKASYYLANDPKTGAQGLSYSFYIDKALAAKQPNRPHDPIFDLNGTGTTFTIANGQIVAQQEPKAQIALDYQRLGGGDPQRYFMEQANPWLKDYLQTASSYAKNYVQNMSAYMQSEGWNKNAIDDYWAKHPSNTPPIQAPNEPQTTTDLINQYGTITDPTERAEFMAANKKILLPAFAAQAAYTNMERVARGELPLQVDPTPPPDVQKLLDQLKPNPNHDKAISKFNAQLIQNNPQLNQYLANTTLYSTTKDLSKFLYQDPSHAGYNEGQLLNAYPIGQQTMKGIVNLGKYDIGYNPTTSQYNFMQNGQMAPGSSAGGGLSLSKKRPKVFLAHKRLPKRTHYLSHTRKIEVAYPKTQGRVKIAGRIPKNTLGGGANDRNIRLV